jgi:hypothetical protein
VQFDVDVVANNEDTVHYRLQLAYTRILLIIIVTYNTVYSFLIVFKYGSGVYERRRQ